MRKKIFEEILINNETVSFGFYLANKKKWLDTDLDTSLKQIGTFNKDSQRLECKLTTSEDFPLRRLFLHHKGDEYYKKLTARGTRFELEDGQRFLASVMLSKFELSSLMKAKYEQLVSEVAGD